MEKGFTWAARVLVFAFVFTASCFKIITYDFWWHLKTGDLILAGHGVPTTEFATEPPEQRWMDRRPRALSSPAFSFEVTSRR